MHVNENICDPSHAFQILSLYDKRSWVNNTLVCIKKSFDWNFKVLSNHEESQYCEWAICDWFDKFCSSEWS